MRRCPQCWKKLPASAFSGERLTCDGCRELYRGGGVRETRRNRIDASRELRVAVTDRSGNRKLGGIPSTMSAGVTCPTSCGLRDSGCYGEFGFLGHHWGNVGRDGLGWREFLAWVRRLPHDQLWRHNVVGDLPGEGDELDRTKLAQLVLSAAHTRGFTFTHKPVARHHRVLRNVNEAHGFTINLSADNPRHADELAEYRAGPVVTVVERDAPDRSRTPAGRLVLVCPAQRSNATCASCGLCASPARETIVAFRAHGQWRSRVEQLVQLRRSA